MIKQRPEQFAPRLFSITFAAERSPGYVAWGQTDARRQRYKLRVSGRSTTVWFFPSVLGGHPQLHRAKTSFFWSITSYIRSTENVLAAFPVRWGPRLSRWFWIQITSMKPKRTRRSWELRRAWIPFLRKEMRIGRHRRPDSMTDMQTF